MASITGLTPPRSGQITDKGANIAGLPAQYSVNASANTTPTACTDGLKRTVRLTERVMLKRAASSAKTEGIR
jgi:ABC-type branched-subunit amino acid transport system ATPase component